MSILNLENQEKKTNRHNESNGEMEEEIRKYYQTKDEKVSQIIRLAGQIASEKISVLITGESGTGKEVLAKAIHFAGQRENGRFIVANCNNLPMNFFDMDIFHIQNHKMHSSQMNQMRPVSFCTLVLDEVADLSATMQLKLLRTLKEQEASRNSIQRGTAVDARIIACSNKNLVCEVGAQKFRNDLFFKLQLIHIELPPLRERPLDIDFYSEVFLQEFNAQFSKNVRISQAAKQCLRAYTWPGNIRELKNVIQRCVLLSKSDCIEVEDLHMIRTNSRTEIALGETLPQVTLMELEQRLILQTLRRMNGNRTHTAKALGISLRALRYKLNELVDCGYEVEGKNTP